MALRKYLKKINSEEKRKSGKDSTSSSRENVNMAGRGGARGACIGNLPLAADVFNTSAVSYAH